MARSLELETTRSRGSAMFVELLRTMRPRQWIKNIFVFAAIFFSEQRLWTQLNQVLLVVGTLLLFCMAASAIYLINDVADIEKDRAHPRKRTRPLAAGRLSPAVAITAAIMLLVIVFPSAYVLDSLNGPDSGLLIVLLAYVLIQGVFYTYLLKNIVIIDIFTIAAGFVLRAVAGAVVLDIAITPWLLICMGLLALFLGLGKRRAELVLLEEGATDHRRILEQYSVPMLDQMISIVTASTIIAYTLFTFTAATLPHQPYPVMIVTIPCVVYGIFRYIYLIHHHQGGGSPEELVLKDPPLALSIAVWGLTVLGLLAIYR